MLYLNIFGDTFPCDKAIKGQDYIHCCMNNRIVATFEGISDFSDYTLVDEHGNPAAYSLPEPTATERLQALEGAMLAMMGGDGNV